MSVVLAFCNNQIYKNKYFWITGNQFQVKIQIFMSFAKGFVFYFRQVFNIFLIRLFLPLLFLFIRDLYYTSRKSYATIFYWGIYKRKASRKIKGSSYKLHEKGPVEPTETWAGLAKNIFNTTNAPDTPYQTNVWKLEKFHLTNGSAR